MSGESMGSFGNNDVWGEDPPVKQTRGEPGVVSQSEWTYYIIISRSLLKDNNNYNNNRKKNNLLFIKLST